MKEYKEERWIQGKELLISYTLIRKKVKNINMRISREGQVTVSSPGKVSEDYLDNFVLSKEEKIVKIRKEYEEKKQTLQEQLTLFYGEDVFEQVCRVWHPLINNRYEIPYPTIQVRKMKSRWGTCHVTKEKIILNRALLGAPMKAIEYVVVHELAHFVYANHSPDFYQVIAEVMPDWKERKALLRQMEI